MDTSNAVTLGCLSQQTAWLVKADPALHALLTSQDYGADQRLQDVRSAATRGIHAAQARGQDPDETVIHVRTFLPWLGWVVLPLGCRLDAEDHVVLVCLGPLPRPALTAADYAADVRATLERFRTERAAAVVETPVAPVPQALAAPAQSPLPEITVRKPCMPAHITVAQVTYASDMARAYLVKVELYGACAPNGLGCGQDGPLAGIPVAWARAITMDLAIWTYDAGTKERRRELKRHIKASLRAAGYPVIAESANIFDEHRRLYTNAYAEP